MVRAQAAMEYLTTYAWAIMALVVVMGGIAYFGFGSINDYIPESCTITEPFICKEWVAYQDSGIARPEIAAIFSNPTTETYAVSTPLFFYEDVAIENQFCQGLQVVGWEAGDSRIFEGGTLLIGPGEELEFVCNPGAGSIASLPVGEKVRIDVEFNYSKQPDGFVREASGTIISIVQE